MLGLSSAITVPAVYAETTSQKIQQANENIRKVDQELSQLERHIKRVEEAMRENARLLAKNEQEIKKVEQQVEQLEKDIEELKQSIEKRKDILAKRAVALQESGGKVDYIEVLAGAKSFSDFVDRVYAVSQIASADKELIEQFEKEKKALEEKKAAVKKKLGELTAMKAELEEMKAVIQQQKEENERLKAGLLKERQKNINWVNELQAQQRQVREAVKNLTGGNAAKQNNNSSASKGTTAPAANKGSIETVITAGYKYIGNSAYKFGGGRTAYDIANGFFDCSGFVHWAFKQAGYNVGASTDVLARQGVRVPVQNMQPGDLVFFDTYKKNGHVGIYLGNGKFIGSQNNTGVAIADMTQGYWKAKFNGHVRRIIY